MVSPLSQEGRTVRRSIELLVTAVVLLIAMVVLGLLAFLPQVSIPGGVILLGVAWFARRRLSNVWSRTIRGFGIALIGGGLVGLLVYPVSVVPSDAGTGPQPLPVQSQSR